MGADQVRGHLDLLLLSIVAGGPAHGYGVISALRERSGGEFDLPEGTVYPALHRLEHAGLLESRWADGSGRRRRLYEITTEGSRALAARRREWQVFSAGVRGVLRPAT
ncbi:MAG TPA: helix-turn-helix transcriptional regulator [Mycobacteriales bacterium]|nr:helix-turn-helix transcriptional regulator [Mycobacteriales bacterium]